MSARFDIALATAGTVGIYLLSFWLYRRTRHPLLQPVLVTIAVLSVLLLSFDIPYSRYFDAASSIDRLLGPAVVALGVTLYKQWDTVRRHAAEILAVLALSSAVGIVSAALTALAMGGSETLALTLAPKSASSPIAMAISDSMGGIPALTAAIAIAVGILGAVLAPAYLRLIGVYSPIPWGIAIGAACHGIGTARALEEGELHGAVAGIAMCLHGVFTALEVPLLWPLVQSLSSFFAEV